MILQEEKLNSVADLVRIPALVLQAGEICRSMSDKHWDTTSRGEYFSFYRKLFPDGPFSQLNSSLKRTRKFSTIYQITVHFYSLKNTSRCYFTLHITLTGMGFPAPPRRLQRFSSQGRVSLIGKVSLLGKGFSTREGFLC